MICFNGPQAKTLYLFVIDAKDAPEAPAEPLVAEKKGLATASWSAAGKTYVLAAELSESDLKRYL
jgi:hypothetical protein